MSPPEIMAIAMIVLLLAFVIIGFPVAFVLAGIGIIVGIIIYGPTSTGTMAAVNTYDVMKNWSLVAIPLFVYMGVVLERAGIAERLYKGLYLMLGGLRGGLVMATMLLATIFAACTGIAGASVVAIGLISMPEMLRYRYNKQLASGAVCAGGGLGVIIPPSIMLIIYGPVAGVSISKLFFAAIIPGLILAGIYLLYMGVRCRLNPELGPPVTKEERARYTAKDVGKLLLTSAVPPVALILLVLGSIFFGVAAPTEAASLGCLGALVITAAYRKLNWTMLKESGLRALRTTTFIVWLVLGAKYFMTTFTKLGGGALIGDMLTTVGAGLGSVALLVIMLFIIFILGMFMDWIGILMVIVPVYVPVIMVMGWEPLWFAILFCITLQISYITPPFAYSIFYLHGIAPPEVTLMDIYKGCFPFVLLQFIALAIIYFWPQIVFIIPNLMMALK